MKDKTIQQFLNVKIRENHKGKRILYDNIEFNSITEAWVYAIENYGYDKSYGVFCKQYKNGEL